jgi:hypothetical protein
MFLALAHISMRGGAGQGGSGLAGGRWQNVDATRSRQSLARAISIRFETSTFFPQDSRRDRSLGIAYRIRIEVSNKQHHTCRPIRLPPVFLPVQGQRPD